MKNKKFSIDGDLLGIVAFVVRSSGPHVGQDGSIHMLREIHDQLKTKDVEPHIIRCATESLGYNRLVVLCAWVAGKATLTPDFKRWLYDNGWLYGATPKLPKKIQQRCRWLNKYVYQGFYNY